MNRRGHLSHKIPNVKLRPAPAASAARPGGVRERSPDNFMNREIQRQAWADADHDDTPAAFNKVSRPLEGVTLTFTGVENKTQLSGMAKDMGAVVDPSLTVHVTHLIAQQVGSQKYNYAVMHRLPILSPLWINVCHHDWINGDEIDPQALAEEYRLMPFVGCIIAVSGIEPMERRNQAMQLITDLGGIYSKALDRQCTHLITVCSATDPAASPKVKWALEQNENRRLQGKTEKNIAIVYEEWFWDCVHFMGRWPEAEYDIRGDRPESRAEQEKAKIAAIEAAAVLPADLPDEKDPVVLRKRKKDGFNDLVGELISTTTAVAPAAAPAVAESSRTAQERSLTPRQQGKRPQSVLHTSRSTAFAGSNHPNQSSLPPIFKGLRIGYIVSEKEAGPLHTALEAHGADVVPREDWEAYEALDYLVVRLASGQRPKGNARQFVTECWIEACVHEEKLLPLDQRLVYQPLSTPIPISDFMNTRIHMTAISDDHTEHCARRLIGALGGSISPELKRETTHVLSDQRSGRKFDRATTWGIPVLPLEWLYASARAGELLDVEDYRYPAPQLPKRTLSTSTTSSSNLTSNLSVMSSLAPMDFAAKKTITLDLHNVNEVNETKMVEEGKEAENVGARVLEKKSSMTDVLRLLAEQEETACAGWKPTRRRPASRVKGLSHSPLTTGTNSPRAISPTPTITESQMDPDPEPTQLPIDRPIRVAYVDPIAEKEKRRLVEALRKGQMGQAVNSSLKRRKRS